MGSWSSSVVRKSDRDNKTSQSHTPQARASLYVYSTEEEIDALVDSITSTAEMFAGLEEQ